MINEEVFFFFRENVQGFKSRIEDVREEILRKRRAGKLPGDTTSVLKAWWQQHSKWPYPTVRYCSIFHDPFAIEVPIA